MNKINVDETLFLFLFRCQKCHKPITAWSRMPKPSTLEEAENTFCIFCVKECGWSSTKMGVKQMAGLYLGITKLKSEMAASVQKIGEWRGLSWMKRIWNRIVCAGYHDGLHDQG
jgi:hypothetical protein